MLSAFRRNPVRLASDSAPPTRRPSTYHIDLANEGIRNEFTTRLQQSNYLSAIKGDIATIDPKPALAPELDARFYKGLLPYASYVARTAFVDTFAFNNELKGIAAPGAGQHQEPDHRVHDRFAAFRCVCCPARRTSVNLLILVVDDEPDVELLFRQQFWRDLREGRFAMEFAQSAQGALQRITECEEDTSLILILSDINMPGMSGLDLLPKAKAARPDVPVIVITAYGDAETKRKALANGADAFLTKPIDFATPFGVRSICASDTPHDCANSGSMTSKTKKLL